MNCFYLVRHAESIANTMGIFQGQTYDTPLSPLGQRQAEKLAAYSSHFPVDRVFSSPLARTRQTAAAIAANKGLRPIFDPHLIEINHGQWEGRSKTEVADIWPDVFSLWQQYPSRTMFPGGEHFQDTKQRIVTWWKGIRDLPGHTWIITHDGIIRALLAYLEGTDLDAVWKYSLHPASLTIVEDSRVRTISDISHLDGAMADLSVHAL